MSQKRILVFCVAVALFTLAPNLCADTLYTSASAFAAATTGDSSITFTAPSSTGYTDTGSSYTDASTGTVFSIASDSLDVTGKNYYGTGTYSEDFLVEDSDAYAVSNLMTIALPSGDDAFGFDIGGIFDAATFTATLSDGSIYALSVPAAYDTTFFGFTSASAISSITISTPADEAIVITDATVGKAVATPEPSSLLLLGIGLAGLAFLGRKGFVADGLAHS